MDAAGYVLTNNHVIRGASSIQVSLADGRKVKAMVIGRDGATDLAVLKIDADGLVPATFGDSESAETGALVWAVGSPFGLERTVTYGILSASTAQGLAGNPSQDFLQTDAAVNPGNSGGPLVDSSGQVIGINTAIVGDAYQGISFAIPSNVAQEIYERIKVGRGWLGVQMGAMDEVRAHAAGMKETTGVYIAAFAPKFPGCGGGNFGGGYSAEVERHGSERPKPAPASGGKDASRIQSQSNVTTRRTRADIGRHRRASGIATARDLRLSSGQR